MAVSETSTLPALASSSVAERVARQIDHYWAQTATAVGSIGLAVSCAFLGDALTKSGEQPWREAWPGGGLYAFALLVLAGTVGSIRQSDNLNSLRSRLAALEHQRAIETADFLERARQVLVDLAGTLRLGSVGRVTVYRHDGQAFIVLARYSEGPTYNGTGRKIYPDDQGLIGFAWQHGEAFVDNLPDPTADFPAWEAALQAQGFGLPRNVLEEMNMQPRCLAGIALKAPKSPDRVGVVVFESVTPGAFTLSEVQNLMTRGRGKDLRTYLADNRALAPTPSVARQKGF